MTFSDRWFADKDKMKECMFGMPIKKKEPPLYVHKAACTTSDTGNNVTWSYITWAYDDGAVVTAYM